MNIWKLFANSKILPEKNFKVDSLDTYLSALTALEITGLTEKEAPQYIKHSLDLFIKINKNQSTLNFFDNANNYNYMSIKNTDDTYPVYYFIIKKEWVSKNTLGLILRMDTVNTFTAERNSFTISNRTMVNREHKDRLKREVYWKDLLTLMNGVEYRVNNSPSTAPSMICYFEDDDGTNKLILRKYSANGALLNEYEGQKFSLEFALFDYYFRLYDSDNEIVYSIRVSEYNAEYALGKYTTLQLSPNFNYQGLEYNPIQYKVRDVRLKRIIDLYPEGITPVLYKKELFTIYEKETALDWYLIYINQNDPDDSLLNPVDCLLCASEEIGVKGISNIYVVDLPNLDFGTYANFIILEEDNSQAVIYYTTSGDTTVKTLQLAPNENNLIKNIKIYKDGANYKLAVAVSNPSLTAFGTALTTLIGDIDSITIVGGKKMYKVVNNVIASTTLASIKASDSIDLSVNDTEKTISSIATIDRTEPKLIKIIKLPYCPTFYSPTTKQLGNGEFKWDDTYKMPKLINMNNGAFKNNFKSASTVFSEFYLADSEIVLNIAKNTKFESKLFHSDYYRKKFVYDSFGFNFMFERMQIPDDTYLDINFVVTSTIHSHFLFEFANYQCPDYANEDYNNILNIARNNEITIYNQQFLNYLRAGYNYDVKAKERNILGAWLGVGTSYAGATSGFMGGSFKKPTGAFTAGVGIITSTINYFANAVLNTAQQEANLEAKMAQLKNQKTSVEGSDDVDLMTYYAKNKAKMVLYEVSPKMKECMFDVFYYTGYISGVMKLPDFTSRYWFNFVSCDLAIETNINIPENCLEDLKNRYNEGITVMHSHEGSYDWNREKENWENSLL